MTTRPTADDTDPTTAALARAPVDTEALPDELEAVIDERLADIREGRCTTALLARSRQGRRPSPSPRIPARDR